jgi:hypothetical protein
VLGSHSWRWRWLRPMLNMREMAPQRPVVNDCSHACDCSLLRYAASPTPCSRLRLCSRRESSRWGEPVCTTSHEAAGTTHTSSSTAARIEVPIGFELCSCFERREGCWSTPSSQWRNLTQVKSQAKLSSKRLRAT